MDTSQMYSLAFVIYSQGPVERLLISSLLDVVFARSLIWLLLHLEQGQHRTEQKEKVISWKNLFMLVNIPIGIERLFNSKGVTVIFQGVERPVHYKTITRLWKKSASVSPSTVTKFKIFKEIIIGKWIP